jgi:deoxyribodipyrimidine photo-lyase
MERAASRLSPYLAWGCLSQADLAAIPRLRPAQRRHAAALAGGERGQTGLPFADACLRYLDAGGWLPAPLRAMLISLAVHHLGACPRLAAQALAALCTDHHPDLLAHGVAEALRRTVDPVAMGRRLDPDGRFTRRWLPELGLVPDEHLQTPWRWCGAAGLLGRRYPEPLVDPATALRNSAVKLGQSRPPAVPRPPAAPRRTKAAPDQMVLPL